MCINYIIILKFTKCLDELQTALNNAEHNVKLMESKIYESNTFEKKYKEQIDNLLQIEINLKLQLENLKEENTLLKLNSQRFDIKT